MRKQVIVGRRGPAGALALLAAFLVWSLASSTGDYFTRIMKLEAMRLPYTAALFGLLGVFVLSLRPRWVVSANVLRLIAWGAVVGQLASVVALAIANLFLPSGIERTQRSFEMFGSQLLVVDFVVGFILGGWLLGALLLALYRFLLVRVFRAGAILKAPPFSGSAASR